MADYSITPYYSGRGYYDVTGADGNKYIYVPKEFVEKGFVAGGTQWLNDNFLNPDLLSKASEFKLDNADAITGAAKSLYSDPTKGYVWKYDDLAPYANGFSFGGYGISPDFPAIQGMSSVNGRPAYATTPAPGQDASFLTDMNGGANFKHTKTVITSSGGGGFFGDLLGSIATGMKSLVGGVSDVLGGLVGGVSGAVAGLGQGVSDAIHGVGTTIAKTPLLNTAAYAALVYAGVPPAAAAGIISANAGASPENVVKSMVLAGVSAEIAKNVAPEVSKMVDNQAVGAAAGQAAGSAAGAALTGKDPLAAAVTSFATSGANIATGEIVKDIPGFDNLPTTAQNAVRAAVTASLQGKDPTTAAVGQAMNEGVKEAVKYGANIFNGSVTNIDQADFGTNQGAVNKIAEMEAREKEAEAQRQEQARQEALAEEARQQAAALEAQRQAEAEAARQQAERQAEEARRAEEERLRREATQPPPQTPITVPGEGGTTANIDPNTGGVTVSEPTEPPPAIETPAREPSTKEPDVTQTLTDAGLKEGPWNPPTDLPPANTPTGLDNERGVNESGVLMPDGSFKTWAQLDELAGVPPGTIYTDGGSTITQQELQDILNHTYTPKGTTPTTPAPKPTTPKPTTTQPTTQPVTKPTTQPVAQPAQQSNPLGMLALLDILGQPQQQQQTQQPQQQGADIKLMENIFGTDFTTPRPEGTKKYSSGGEIEALLHLLRS